MICTHHFVLSTPNSTESLGVCKFCGDEKLFSNAPPEAKRWLGGYIKLEVA